MIVLVTNKLDLTTDRVIAELDGRGVPFFRLNTEDFPSVIRSRHWTDVDGLRAELDLGHGRLLVPEQITAVWYRRPEPPAIDVQIADPVARRFAERESAAVLHGFLALTRDVFWVNDPDANRLAEHKVVQLQRAAAEGFSLPETLVTNDAKAATEFAERFSGRVVAKSASQAFIHPTSRAQVYTNELHTEHFAYLKDVRHAPVILQERIDKALEIRATVIGNHVFAASIDSQASETTSGDWRRNVFEPPRLRSRL